LTAPISSECFVSYEADEKIFRKRRAGTLFFTYRLKADAEFRSEASQMPVRIIFRHFL
jgi:hypothetical protein